MCSTIPPSDTPLLSGPTLKSSNAPILPLTGVVGRPPGDAARLAELKARLLATAGDKVIRKTIEIALTDGHPVQGAALKMCLDRVLPVSMFEKDASGGRSAVTINITGLNAQPQVTQDDVVDIDFQDVDDKS